MREKIRFALSQAWRQMGDILGPGGLDGGNDRAAGVVASQRDTFAGQGFGGGVFLKSK